MFLFRLTASQCPGYDAYDAHAVIAGSEQLAREVAANVSKKDDWCKRFDRSPWLNHELTRCELIATVSTQAYHPHGSHHVISSFNAG